MNAELPGEFREQGGLLLYFLSFSLYVTVLLKQLLYPRCTLGTVYQNNQN
ncbi:hypothetical protein HanXRQr2_Chr06g0269831 [Helianthus annuus]|uniref:Uncharacterized protein n=1 Tax=Helianthus annuus TaxID=4232 RepID=A0A9K3NK91_HELAN|nr:hypothetical protein HanXRQr2_Chr06g0269831 [Helianthus annuus]KAJ0916336.1 hypothetical protein HanPSC8_Chr06g0260461 [Helianthus annuus]